MTDDGKGQIVVELVFDRESFPSDAARKLFVDTVNLLVSTICWFGPNRPPIQVNLSQTNHSLGGKRTIFDVSIMLTNRTIEQVSPFAINYGRVLLLSLFAPFRLGVLLLDDSKPKNIIARICRDDCHKYTLTHKVML
jgi:hypothetical protein